jgi:hypothetical protein
MLYCPSIDELRVVHETYWQGVRYDNQGQQVEAAPSGGHSGTSGSGFDPGSDSRYLVSGMTECAELPGSDPHLGCRSAAPSMFKRPISWCVWERHIGGNWLHLKRMRET